MVMGPANQLVNPEMVAGLGPHFVSASQWYQDPARLVGSVLGQHRDGGGMLMEGWLADSIQAFGVPNPTQHYWSVNNVFVPDFSATLNGGPFCDFDGATESMYIPDSAWNEFGANRFFTCRWVYLDQTTGANQAIIGKYNTVGNQRSWLLFYQLAGGVFAFTCSQNGVAIVTVPSTHSFSYQKWYWVAAFFNPATLMRIYVGEPTDTDLTIDDLAVGVPANVFNGSAILEMAASNTSAATWLDGRIGLGFSRGNNPAASADSFARRIFHSQRWFYAA